MGIFKGFPLKMPIRGKWHFTFHMCKQSGFAQHQKSGAGFTLIELLVVISIIGLLASVVLVSLNSARTKARDAKRVADIKQIATALELYFDQNGSYPQCTAAIGGDQWCGQCEAVGVSQFTTAMQPLVDQKFLGKVPTDPLSTTPCYTFEYYTNNQANAYGNTCGGTNVVNFPYVLRFGTEQATNLNFALFDAQRVAGKEYCIVGSK